MKKIFIFITLFLMIPFFTFALDYSYCQKEMDVNQIVSNPEKYIGSKAAMVSGQVVDIENAKTPGPGVYLKTTNDNFFVSLGGQVIKDENNNYYLSLNENENIYIGDYVLACGDIEKIFWLPVGMIRTKNHQIFTKSKVRRVFSNNTFTISETVPLIPGSQFNQWKLGNTSIVNFDKHVELLKIDNTPPDTDIVGVIYYNFIFKAKDLGYTVINLDENQYDDNRYLVNVLKTNSYLVYIRDLPKALFKK